MQASGRRRGAWGWVGAGPAAALLAIGTGAAGEEGATSLEKLRSARGEVRLTSWSSARTVELDNRGSRLSVKAMTVHAPGAEAQAARGLAAAVWVQGQSEASQTVYLDLEHAEALLRAFAQFEKAVASPLPAAGSGTTEVAYATPGGFRLRLQRGQVSQNLMVGSGLREIWCSADKLPAIKGALAGALDLLKTP